MTEAQSDAEYDKKRNFEEKKENYRVAIGASEISGDVKRCLKCALVDCRTNVTPKDNLDRFGKEGDIDAVDVIVPCDDFKEDDSTPVDLRGAEKIRENTPEEKAKWKNEFWGNENGV